MRRLRKHGVPEWAALTLVILGAVVAMVGVGAVVGESVARFQGELPFYRERLQVIFSSLFTWVEGLGLGVRADDLAARFDTSRIMALAGTTPGALLAAASDAVVVALTVIFMLVEANDLPNKLRAMRKSPDDDLADFSQATDNVQKYVAIKSLVSAMTALLVILLTWICDVDFPMLWGLLAFLFNFVPNIGSVIAAVPAVLLALVQHGPGTATAVGVGYIAINMIIGNVVEPRMMGQRLGLSTLVVFLSLIFWGWVWGPLGMLLSVPLTVIVKIILEQSNDGHAVAVLLGPGIEFDERPTS
jgi:predicted PurR-regulated permease PerM